MKYVNPGQYATLDQPVHPSQRQHHVKPVPAPLYVVTAISNPQRYYSRYKLYQGFEKMCADAGAVLYTVELALRDRHHEITLHDNPRHIQLRSPDELWHKENLLNLAISRLPADWEYVAWVDADVQFARPDWVAETIHQLQHYKIVQMWSHAQDVSPLCDLGDEQKLSRPFQSFCCSFVKNIPFPKYLADGGSSGGYGGGQLWHSGYAWAARRSAISDLGGLGDIGILGSGDHHMAAALIGKVERTIHGQMHANYLKYWKQWQQRAIQYIDRQIGFVPGLLLHYWHGPKRSRGYIDRWQVLVNNHYDPEVDIKRDPQGVLQFAGDKWKLKNQIREYFKQRNEDSVDI